MRQITFRGKRVDNGQWVEGDLMQNYIHHEGYLTIVQSGCIYYKVITESVGQFTGLRSKSGEDIYEGHIVLAYTHINGNFIDRVTEKFEVIFKGVSFQYKPIDGKEYKQYTVSPIGCEVEVIGNITDNPELINK
jgi:uncharacterized phage protein (TIGR01671 family)